MPTRIYLLYTQLSLILKSYQEAKFDLKESSIQVLESYTWVYGKSTTLTELTLKLIPRGEVFEFLRFLEYQEILRKTFKTQTK